MHFSLRKTGYTLIELMVVVAVIGIMTAIALSSSSDGRDQKSVDVAARQLAAQLRLAQGYAVAGRLIEDGKLPCEFTFFTDGTDGYGLTYTYSQAGAACTGPTTVEDHTLLDGVTFVTAADSVSFSIPHGTAQSSATFTLEKGSAQESVCIDDVGRIREDC